MTIQKEFPLRTLILVMGSSLYLVLVVRTNPVTVLLMFCYVLCDILTIPWAAMSAAKVLLPEVPGVQSDRRTSCPPTSVRSISISTASACSALSYSTTPKPRTGLPSSWASCITENYDNWLLWWLAEPIDRCKLVLVDHTLNPLYTRYTWKLQRKIISLPQQLFPIEKSLIKPQSFHRLIFFCLFSPKCKWNWDIDL